jgi:NAD(P)-dependent dehydrogenase (short-subunit alcohol dehydrogenase family)
LAAAGQSSIGHFADPSKAVWWDSEDFLMLLKDKVAIVTGAASKRGIGRAIADVFAENGARVVILDLDESASRLAAAALRGQGHRGFACDVVDRDRCIALAAVIIGDLGGIDILVNNAGITSPKRFMDIDEGDLDSILDVNLRGTVNMCQAVIPHMRRRKSGAIVNLSSVSAQRGGGIFGGPHYSAAKGAVLSLTRAMARELGPDNIRVNAICPSLIDTDIVGGAMTPERRAEITAGIPLGRIGEAREVGGAALFLASDLASYCTGSTVDVNGGSHIH